MCPRFEDRFGDFGGGHWHFAQIGAEILRRFPQEVVRRGDVHEEA